MSYTYIPPQENRYTKLASVEFTRHNNNSIYIERAVCVFETYAYGRMIEENTFLVTGLQARKLADDCVDNFHKGLWGKAQPYAAVSNVTQFYPRYLLKVA